MPCTVVKTEKGNVARVHGEKKMSPEGEKAIAALIDAATEQMKISKPESAIASHGNTDLTG